MMETEHRGIVVPAGETSESVVVRWPAGVVVLGGPQDDVAAALRSLRPDGDLEPASGLLIERLRMLRHGDVAAGVSTPGGLRLFTNGRGAAHVGGAPVTGQAVASSTTGVEDTVTHENAVTDENAAINEVDVPLGASPIWIGIGTMDEAGVEESVQRTSLDFSFGVVRGRGIVLARPPSAPLDPRLGVDSGLVERDFAVVDFAVLPADVDRKPLPIQQSSGIQPLASASEEEASPIVDDGVSSSSSDTVLGIQCSRDHFNNPSAAYCQVCGISMVHVTHHLVRGERPTLGFLVFDDGSTFALDRSYLIGREPSVAHGSSLAPLTADDNDHTVSRSHAELILDGWDLTVADLGSTNGTFVWDADRRDWQRVLPNRPAVVTPGTSVAVGRKTFVYEPVARAV